MKKIKDNFEALLPFLILAVMVILFSILTGGQIFAVNSLRTLVKQTLNIILAGLGMTFVVALGGTDITQGSLVGLCAAFAASIGADYSIPMAFVASILVGTASGMFLGVVNARFKVPSFMASLAMLIALRAMVSSILGSRSVILPEALRRLDQFYISVPVVIILALIICYLFNFTPFGAYCRAIGENENAVKFAGVNVTLVKIAAFAMSGLMTGIAALFVLARVGGSSNILGVGFEMRIMMAMFIGGIPVSGGSGTKIHKMLIGAFMITLLESGLVMSGCSGSITQLIRGIVLLAVVYITIQTKKRLAAA